MDRVIIAAAGDGNRWGNYLNVPKHLVEVSTQGRTEKLIERTARLFSADTLVIGPPFDIRYNTSYSKRIDGATIDLYPTKTDQDKIMSSKPFWSINKRTIVTFGDIWFSEEAVKTIKQPVKGIQFYGRFGPSKTTGSPYGELFAVSFGPEDIQQMLNGIHDVAKMFLSRYIARAAIWELYSWMNDIHPLTNHIKVDFFTEIDDFTEDFDFPRDFDLWLKRFRDAGN